MIQERVILKLFGSIKKTRDNLFHGEQIDDQTLPIIDLNNLLRKYLSADLRLTAGDANAA